MGGTGKGLTSTGCDDAVAYVRRDTRDVTERVRLVLMGEIMVEEGGWGEGRRRETAEDGFDTVRSSPQRQVTTPAVHQHYTHGTVSHR